MKLFRLPAILFLCAVTLAVTTSKSFALSWAQSYGLGSYDIYGAPGTDPFYSSGYDTPLAIAKMPDGGFVVAGYLAMPKVWLHNGRGNLGALVRYSADGTILWQTLLRQDNDSYSGGQLNQATNDIGQIATDAQGNIFVCGGKGNPSNYGRTPFVAKFSPEGALLWENGFNAGNATIGDPPQVVPIGVGPTSYLGLTSDGGVLVTLSQTRPNFSYTIPVLAKFNADGTLAFEKAFDNAIQYLGSTPVCESKDGSRYVMAFEYDTDGSTPGMRYGLLLLVTDTSGNIIAQRAYNHADNSGEHPVAIIATNDGNFATLSKLTNDTAFLVRKLNSDLSAEIFAKRVTRTSGGFLPGNSLVETSDGSVLIGSATNNPSNMTGTDVLLFKLSSAGDFVFASLLGGPLYEGAGSISYGSSIATELVGGGYGFAATSQSYHTGGPVSGAYHLPDWWMAKTDANRKVRNFNDVMEDMSEDLFNITGSPQAAEDFSPFTPPNYPNSLTTTSSPHFVLENLATEVSTDLPTLMIQAAGPRILSDHNVETIVEQHFSYHVLTAYFPAGSQLTYTAEGLPADFVIDPQTGIISGIAHVGSETVENNLPPIPITVHATDGTDTADGTIELAISDGAPLFAVTPSSSQADPVLMFSCYHLGKQAGRIMNVEYMAPDHPGLWQWLQNGSNGYMTYERASSHYVLNSTSYPQQNGVYFRAKLKVQGRDDLVSNVVGPFDLASGTTRAAKTLLSLTRNGLRADFDFRATELSPASGVSVRVQSTTTPGAEGTWSDLQDTGTGHMTEDPQSHIFSHTSNDIPKADGVYFRAVASASGTVDSLSNIIGPYNLIADTPPMVTLDQPSGSISGDGQEPSTPLVFESGSNLHITGSASFPAGSQRSIQNLSILVDGTVIETRDSVNSIESDYLTTRLGLRQLDLLATDDLGATGRAGTGTLWIRIDPAGSHARGSSTNRSHSAGSKTNAATSGNTFILTTDGGNWSDPNSWTDVSGNHGVPGANDLVLIAGKAVVSNIDVQVGGMILQNGRFDGTYLTIGQSLTVFDISTMGPSTSGNFYLVINQGATCQMVNFLPTIINGNVENHGTWRMMGFGGLSVNNFHNTGLSDFQMPLLKPATVQAGLPAIDRALTTQSFLNSGHIAVSGIVAQGAGNIVAQGAGNIVAQGAGNMVNPNGGTIVASGAGNIVAQGGGNIVAQGGGNIVAQGAGNIVAQGAGNVAVQQGSCLIGNDGASIVAQGAGNIVAQGAGNIVAQGGGNIVAQGAGNRSGLTNKVRGRSAPAGAVVPTGFVQTDGVTDLNFVTITGAVDVQGGMISGSGLIDGSLSMTDGVIAPGHSSGQLVVTGDYNQSSNSTMIVEANGGEPGQFDQVQVGGTANLAGALQFHTLNGYAPLPEDPFNPIGYNSLNGNFEFSSPNGQISTNTNGMLLVLAPTATNPLNLTSVVSRKVHGTAGPFDIALPLTGQPGVECRNSNGNHTIVFFFSNNITSAGAGLTSSTGTVAGTTISGNTVAVDLNGVANGQQMSVSLQNVIDEFGQIVPEVTVPMSTLVGDTNGNGLVNASDITQTKIQSGQAATATNFRTDVTVNGAINASDVSLVKLRSGTGIETGIPDLQPNR